LTRLASLGQVKTITTILLNQYDLRNNSDKFSVEAATSGNGSEK